MVEVGNYILERSLKGLEFRDILKYGSKKDLNYLVIEGVRDDKVFGLVIPFKNLFKDLVFIKRVDGFSIDDLLGMETLKIIKYKSQ